MPFNWSRITYSVRSLLRIRKGTPGKCIPGNSVLEKQTSENEIIQNSEGWNEESASASEANIKADRCELEDMDKLQKRCAEKFQRDHSKD